MGEPYNKGSIFVRVRLRIRGLPAIIILIFEVPRYIFVTAKVSFTGIF